MKQKTFVTLALLLGIGLGAAFGPAAGRWMPSAQAAPPVVVPGGALASIMAGKPYPLSLKSEQIDTSYSYIGLVDLQGKLATYVTKGETVSLAGETYLVAYESLLLVTPGEPLRPTPGKTATLILIDFKAVQAMGGFAPVPPPASK